MTAPRIVTYRSLFRGRLLYAVPGWLLAETSTHLVTATVPGAETIQLAGPREEVIPAIAAGRERTHRINWDRSRVLWMTPWGAGHSLGHFWNADSGEFRGYYVNLQAPLRRSPYGVDSMDHVLDIVVKPNGEWHWKDEGEFAEAVELGIFSSAEAAAIRAEGERVIASLPQLIPTGWDDWRPDPSWPVLTLPDEIQPSATSA